jgi:signal peptidase II
MRLAITMNRRLFLSLLLFVSSVGCDQVTKRVAAEQLAGEPTHRYLGDVFRLLYTENTGAFLGLGADWPDNVRFIVFTLLSSVVVIVALGWLWLRLTKDGNAVPWVPLLGGTLLLAGGVGNLWDRIARDGAVIDFMNLGIGSLRTGIFNIADVHIVVGGLMMLWWERGHDDKSQPVRS